MIVAEFPNLTIEQKLSNSIIIKIRIFRKHGNILFYSIIIVTNLPDENAKKFC